MLSILLTKNKINMKKEKTLLILGAGGHGKSVAEAALLSGDWEKIVFIDDRWPKIKNIFNFPVISNIKKIDQLKLSVHGAIAAAGNNTLREKWQSAIINANLLLISVIHPSAFVSKSAHIGPGSAIMAQAMIGVDARLGTGTIINANTTLDHDAYVGDFAHLGIGVQIAGGVRVGARAWLQAGCCAGYCVDIPAGQLVPPGTALIANK